jgi:urease accessory protein
VSNITALMRTLQFGDSLLPVGSFSFSMGLEAAGQQQVVADTNSLRQFVRTATRQAATSDGIALLEAHRAALVGDLPRVLRADHAVLNRKLNEEMRTMTVRTGRKLAELSQRVVQTPLMRAWFDAVRLNHSPGTHPVALGITFAELGLPETTAFAVHQYGVATTILSAALRLMRVDHFDAQMLLFETNTAADADYTRVASGSLGDMATFAPTIDVLAAVHTRALVRLFMS